MSLDYFILFKVTCHEPKHPNKLAATPEFFYIDTGEDAGYQCPNCGAESSHSPHVTDDIEIACRYCQGSGKKTTKAFVFDCPFCEGTGMRKHSHTAKLVGKVFYSELEELAAKNPQGWR